MARIVKVLALIVLVALGYWLWPQGAIRHAPGVLVASEPAQVAMAPKSLGERAGFKLTAVAEFQLTARVLHSKRYWSGDAADLVPVDLALGWGAMSDQAVLDQLEISQTNRFFFMSGRAPRR